MQHMVESPAEIVNEALRGSDWDLGKDREVLLSVLEAHPNDPPS